MPISIEEQRKRWIEANRRYRKTEKGKAAAKRAESKRSTSEKRLNYRQEYLASFIGRAYNLRRGAKQRALKYNLPFDLTVEWVEERLSKKVCEITGLPLQLITTETYGTFNNIQPFSPSIDRIIPKLGYIQENCRIVCNIFNQCKMHWTDADVDIFVRAYYERNLLCPEDAGVVIQY